MTLHMKIRSHNAGDDIVYCLSSEIAKPFSLWGRGRGGPIHGGPLVREINVPSSWGEGKEGVWESLTKVDNQEKICQRADMAC